ncbi:MAG TPA: choice-of-anchor tandem repeat GloVer-containing protein, partial [Rhizomicrobium sp.]|nr:choice-of-anchor tandem repeat GloVer-containing protein [Rhizomicrobium sp.]
MQTKKGHVMSKSTKLRSRLRSSAVLPLAAIAALTATGAPAAPGAGREKVLYTFTGEYGNYPTGNIVRDTAGNLYGTTAFGGDGLGIVFELSPDGKGGWTYNVIYNFTGGADGAFPESGVI